MKIDAGWIRRAESHAKFTRQGGREPALSLPKGRPSLRDSRSIHAVGGEHIVERNYTFQFVDIAAVYHR
jgi:hypothetical protein